MLATLPLFELARVLVRVDHVVRFIVNANHSRRPHSERMAALMTDGEPENVVPMLVSGER